MKKRNINLDLIRTIAVILVISVHFLLNSGFYSIPIVSKSGIALNSLRIIFICCVPLFLTLTGYLMNKKELSIKYYKGIVKTLSIYVIISIFCIIFRIFYLKEHLSIVTAIIQIMNFTADSYSWYIKMYIGLFCFIPFLNLIFNSIKTQKVHKILILTLFIFTILPTILNIYDTSSLKAIITTKVNNPHTILFNDYWHSIWPITYYFLGAYISKYNTKYSLKKLLLIFISVFIIFATFNNYRNYGQIYYEAQY